MPSGLTSVSTEPTAWFVAGSICVTVFSVEVGHPDAAREPRHDLRAELRGDSRQNPLRLWVDPRHGAAQVRRDPDAVGREEREPRLLADGRPGPRACSDDGSIRPTASSSSQTHPYAAAADRDPLGRRHRRAMVPVTAFVAGSMRDTVSSPELETHTDPAPTATSSGTAPTGIVATTFVRRRIDPAHGTGSARSTSAFTTHRIPAPATIPIGSLPTVTVARTSTGPGAGGVGLALDVEGGGEAGESPAAAAPRGNARSMRAWPRPHDGSVFIASVYAASTIAGFRRAGPRTGSLAVRGEYAAVRNLPRAELGAGLRLDRRGRSPPGSAPPTELHVGRSYEELADGRADLAFLCGLPYVHLADAPIPSSCPSRHRSSRASATAARPSLLRRDRGRGLAVRELRGPAGCVVGVQRARLAVGVRGGASAPRAGWARLGATSGASWRRDSTTPRSAWWRRAGVDGAAIDSQVLSIALRDEPELDRPATRWWRRWSPDFSTIQPVVASVNLDPGDAPRPSGRALTSLATTRLRASPSHEASCAHSCRRGRRLRRHPRDGGGRRRRRTEGLGTPGAIQNPSFG